MKKIYQDFWNVTLLVNKQKLASSSFLLNLLSSERLYKKYSPCEF